MSNIATNIEQTKHLLELGLDPKTADMVWMCNKWLYSIKDNILNQEQFSEQDTLAWSLTALLEVMPRNPSITYHLFSSLMPHETDVDKTNGWVCDRTEFVKMDEGTFHEGTKRLYECFKGERPIDAAYEMVCWLLEQGLIKKGDNDEGDRRKTSTY